MSPEALRAVIPALRQARDELQSDLTDWLANTPDGAQRFTARERARALRALEGAMGRVRELEPAIAGGLEAGRAAVGPLAVENLGKEITRLGSIFGEALHVPQIDTAAVIARGDRMLWKRHERSARRYAGAVGEDIQGLLAVGLAKHETFEQLVTRLRRISGGRGLGMAGDPAGDIADGLFTRYKHWADRLVRTEMMHAYNVQHGEAIAAVNEARPDDEDPYLRKWDASADRVTCPLCKELDGTVATLEGTFAHGIKGPPAHPHCRCVVLAWLARWGNIKGEKPVVGEIPKPPPRAPKPDPKPKLEEPPSRMPPPSPEVNYQGPAVGSEAWARERASRNRSDAQRRRQADKRAHAVEASLPSPSKPAIVAPMPAKPIPKPEPAPVTPAVAPPSEPLAPVDRSLPQGARVMSLRKRGLVEKITLPPTEMQPSGVTRWQLNDRGLAHFAKLAEEKKRKAAGIGVGICQICERECAIVRGRISLHGYNRPGHGFIWGECRGSNELPWSQSCAALAKWVSTLRDMLVNSEEELASFDRREAFTVQGQKYETVEGGVGKYVPTIEKIIPTDPRWGETYASKLSELKNRIDALRSEIKRQGARLAAWKPTGQIPAH